MTKQPTVVALAYSRQLRLALSRRPAPQLRGAACVVSNPEIFYSESKEEIVSAKRICASCPAISACASWGLANEVFGIFGGLTATERKLLRGGRALVEVTDLNELHRELNVINRLSADEVSRRFGVDKRTVVRWRQAIRDDLQAG